MAAPWHTVSTPARGEAADYAAAADQLRQQAGIPGLAVVVLRGTAPVLALGLGVADVRSGAPVTPETLFDIASVSKPISAVVALRLAERGLVDLDAPMDRHAGYADFCRAARAAPLAGGLFFRDSLCETQPPTLRQTLAMQMNGSPGTRFFYNPPGYSWASRALAQAGGAPFSTLVAQEVFGPAGMTGAARQHRGLKLPPALLARLATPHRIGPSGQALPASLPPAQGDGAAGGVVCSAVDLARFSIALDDGRLLSAASRQAMWTAGRSPAGAPLPYGLGWYVQDLDGDTLLWHGGLWEDAWSALLLKVPERRLTLVLLANSDGLRWPSALDEAAVQRSPFVRAALAMFRPAPA